MQINFKKITVHNFGSYNHAEIDLQNKGFCAVNGRNYYKKDNAFSNGSGKSMLYSAICFTLTGETIKGTKSNLKNRYNDEPDSYTKLTFTADNDEYDITRYIAPKSDMTIIKNNIDVSGKGIRESEKKLGELLPDLTKDLIASTIIIGQGMPNKLSSFSPSGRKELLEKLTKSDFMIDEVKKRIQARQQEIDKQLQEYKDSLLVNNTKLSSFKNNLDAYKNELANFKTIDYDLEINKSESNLASFKTDLEILTNNLKDLQSKKDTDNAELINVTSAKATEKANLTDSYNKARTEVLASKSSKETEIRLIKQEISKIEAIKDTCPTCGRKFDNVVKPDTSAQKAQVTELESDLAAINSILLEQTNKYSSAQNLIDTKYAELINRLNTSLVSSNQQITLTQTNIKYLSHNIENESNNLMKLQYAKENDDKKRSELLQVIENIEKEIITITELNLTLESAINNLQQHLDVIKKIDTLVKRDFRGYLLFNIINFLDRKAKEYCETVYETRDLDVKLDGNALDITYCGKCFDNLSGGEQQRVDLILQFAIRDLLSTYLNYSSNIIVLDEIFDNLDKVATGRILELIMTKLKDIESVFIISHHSDSLNIGYDYMIKINKNEEGISEVIE